jgi:predicted RNA-binding protein YlqC (UPF0109 family)
LKEFLELLIKNLVEFPEQVSIVESESSDGVELTVTVAKEDLGRIIGKNGRVIKAIRVLVRNMGGRDQKNVNVQIQ